MKVLLFVVLGLVSIAPYHLRMIGGRRIGIRLVDLRLSVFPICSAITLVQLRVPAGHPRATVEPHGKLPIHFKKLQSFCNTGIKVKSYTVPCSGFIQELNNELRSLVHVLPHQELRIMQQLRAVHLHQVLVQLTNAQFLLDRTEFILQAVRELLQVLIPHHIGHATKHGGNLQGDMSQLSLLCLVARDFVLQPRNCPRYTKRRAAKMDLPHFGSKQKRKLPGKRRDPLGEAPRRNR
mmetsp:Transcript_9274/g.17106  ORF Transcript_9274/g.17106 Transcript_9274/m.17106 type:complete len:236 (+) Transcript_9274:192-899(+)